MQFRTRHSSFTTTDFMIKNYLKIAWRNLVKHKSFSFINILGLAIGIGACLIIFLYVHDELTFDLYNVKADRIARVTTRMHTPESDLVIATSPVMLASNLKFFQREHFIKRNKVSFPFSVSILLKDPRQEHCKTPAL